MFRKTTVSVALPAADKKKPKGITTHIASSDLVQLNQLQADIELAKEKFHHTITKGHLLRALSDVQRLQTECNQLKMTEQARVIADKHTAGEKEALANKQAAEARFKDLATEIRCRYDIPQESTIDPVSGEIAAPRN